MQWLIWHAYLKEQFLLVAIEFEFHITKLVACLLISS